MAIWDAFKNKKTETRELNLKDLFNFNYYGTIDQSYINQMTALENEAMYASIKIISESLAGLPIQTFIKNGDERIKVNDYFLYDTLNDPNKEQNKFIFWETFYTNLLTHGNAYAYIYRDSYSAKPLSLYILPSKYVTVKRNIEGKVEYHFKQPNKELKIYKKENIYHELLTSYDGLVGISPIEQFKLQILESITADNYNYNFFDKGLLTNTVLEIPETHKYTSETLKMMLKQFMNRNAGLGNQNKPIVLDAGTKVNEFKGYSNKDNSVVELRKEALLKIARIYRIPPHMLQELGNATFSNISHQSMDFYKQTLLPHIQRTEWSIKHQLIPSIDRHKYFVKLNTTSVLRGADTERAAFYDIMHKIGVYSINDILKLEDMPKVDNPNADYHWIQLQTAPIEKYEYVKKETE